MADNVEIQGLEFQIQGEQCRSSNRSENLKKALSGLKSVTVEQRQGA